MTVVGTSPWPIGAGEPACRCPTRTAAAGLDQTVDLTAFVGPVRQDLVVARAQEFPIAATVFARESFTAIEKAEDVDPE